MLLPEMLALPSEPPKPPPKKYQKAFKCRLYPTNDQAHYLNQSIGAGRKAWNEVLARLIAQYECYKITLAHPELELAPKPTITISALSAMLTALKKEPDFQWLNDYSSVILQQRIIDLYHAFQRFFTTGGQVGYPKFRSRFKHNSIRLTSQVIKVDKNQLYLPKSKTPIHIRLSRPLPSPPSQVTITRTRAGHYYASFLCVFEPTTTSGTDIVGIDFGLTNLIVTSDGQIIQPPQFYRQLEHKLAKAQAKLSRTKPGSNNRYKARLKVAKISAKIANKRADFIHQLTSALIKRSATIVIENLNVAGMQQSNNLGKSVTDASLAEIRRQLEYKTVFSQHTNLIIVSRFYASTKQCYVTGKRHNVKRGATEWYCPDCDKVHDRDQNAALNLAKVAHEPSMQARMLNQHGKIFKLFTSSEL